MGKKEKKEKRKEKKGSGLLLAHLKCLAAQGRNVGRVAREMAACFPQSHRSEGRPAAADLSSS